MRFSGILWGLFGLAVLTLFGTVEYYKSHSASYSRQRIARNYPISKGAVLQAMDETKAFMTYPSDVSFNVNGRTEKVVVQYAFDSRLQEAMHSVIRSYRPDYAAFVALDPETGRVLSMISLSQKGEEEGNLALRATFPSASVFKVVTAAAAIAEKNFSANTIIPFNGTNHTLYKKNILKDRITRWTRYMTLKEAFARSVNTVFGKIGAYTLAPAELKDYASRFGFNEKISADVPMEQGRAEVSDDPWERAEAASGFTKENTMSPLQGALIAATISNNGTMMEPYVIQSVHAQDGTELYEASPRVVKESVDPRTASEIRKLMQETVNSGTSKKSFRRFFKGLYADLEVGGKTGTLTGNHPPGKYDWFVGFANGKDQKIAIAALTIHKKYWTVKSSQIARIAIEKYFKLPPEPIVAGSNADRVVAGAGW